MIENILKQIQEHKAISVWERLADSKLPIVLYGTGNGAEKIIRVMKSYSIEVAGVFVSDDFARGQKFLMYQVETLSQIQERLSDFIIVVAFGTHIESVMNRIIQLDQQYPVYIPDVPVIGDVLFTPSFFEEHISEFQAVYQMLADELSKRVFVEMILYKITGELKYLMSSVTDAAETYQEILRLGTEESYADLGAYRGDTVEEFLHYASQGQGQQDGYETYYRSILAMEPDGKNYKKLCAAVERLGLTKAECIHTAAGDSDGFLHFDTGAGRQSHINPIAPMPFTAQQNSPQKGYWATAKARRAAAYQEAVQQKHQTKIPVHRLDTLAKSPITFINMDVEGAERQAIQGSRETILSYKPKMLIACYHRTPDLFEIPLQISEIRSDYRFYYRRYSCIPAWEINLLCI